MNSDFLSAIEAWAKGAVPFSGSVAGPWTPSRVPRGSTFPYGVYAAVGATALDWTTNGQSVEPVRVQFSVFATGGQKIAMDYASQIASRFAIGTILSLSNGRNLGVMPIFGPVPIPCNAFDAASNPVYHAAVDFRIWFQNA